VVPLTLLGLDLCQLLGREGLEVGRVLGVGRAARGAVAAALGPDLVPAEATDLKREREEKGLKYVLICHTDLSE
jgi:tryptophan synthase alpha subunit